MTSSAKKFSLLTVVFSIIVSFSTYISAAEPVDTPWIAADPCRTLVAGQHHDVGELCLDVVGNELIVEYSTEGGWYLGEAHAWLGTLLSDLPQTKKGNPQIGKFPYKSESIDQDGFVFAVPLSVLGDSLYCEIDYLLSAHAVVYRLDQSGEIQSETAWASGFDIGGRSWATYDSFQFGCGGQDDDDDEGQHETAWMFGDYAFNETYCGNKLVSQKWGWSHIVSEGEVYTGTFWAGAGGNDTSKGFDVGTVTVDYSVAGLVVVSISVDGNYANLIEDQIYIGDEFSCTAAPGQLTLVHDDETGNNVHSHSFAVSGGDVHVAVHGSVGLKQ